jgi:hypothetical protein
MPVASNFSRGYSYIEHGNSRSVSEAILPADKTTVICKDYVCDKLRIDCCTLIVIARLLVAIVKDVVAMAADSSLKALL